jgi:PST family polysaccharide transporter
MREFRQRARLTIDLLTFMVSSGLTLLLAFRGWGASSFAWGGVIGVVVALVGCGIAAPGYLRPGWDRATARELIRYGAPLAGASLFVLATLNTDSAVVGATLGPVALGLYRVAFTMSSWPVRAISETARRVSFAGFSRAAESTHTLTEGFTSGLSPLLIASVPACALLAALPRPVIRAVYGDQWSGAAGALRYLAILGLLRIVFELCYDFLVAAGRSRALLTVQALWLAALIPALIIGAHHHGLSGVGMGHIVVAAALIAPAYLVSLRAVGVRPTRVAAVSWRPLLGGVVVVAVAVAVNHVAGDSDVAVAGACLLAMVAYVPVAVPLSAMRGVWRVAERRLGRGGRVGQQGERHRVKVKPLPRRVDVLVHTQEAGMADESLSSGESASV